MATEAITATRRELETPCCPMCGDTVVVGSGYRFPPFAVRRCATCGLWYLTPRLVEDVMRQRYLDAAYFQGGASSGYASSCTQYGAQETALRTTFRRFLQTIERAGLVGGRLLEIGSGYGYFLAEAAPYFRSVQGVEVNPGAAAHASGLGYAVTNGGIDTLVSDAHFDRIVSVCVIEHIYEPIPFLQALAQSLAPAGWMIHACPQMDSFWLKLMGHRWPSFKVPEHVAFYDQSHLHEILRRAGAIEVRAIAYPHAFSLGSIAEKLGRALPAALADRVVFLPATMCAAAARFT